MVSPARAAAFDILLRVEQERAYAAELLHSERLRELSASDRGLCTELVMGVLRWRSRLDEALGTLTSHPPAKLDEEVLNALRLGAYQLGFLDRVPGHAAVNESVELVKRARKRSAMGLVNAVLRKLAATPDLLRPAPAPAPGTLPELAQSYAHPLWLLERWGVRLGLENTAAVCAYDQQAPQTTIRIRDQAAAQELRAEGIELEPGRLLRKARRVVSGDVTKTQAYAERRIAVQDEASQLVAELAGRGERLLDCCAAPGGKSAILAERNPGARIVAVDLHPRRAELMRRLLPGAPGDIAVLTADATSLPLRGGFDSVLADVPCSGTGTLARNPEIKWRLTPADLANLQRRQVAILSSAMEQVRPGGRLIYSTCSLEPEENQDVVNEVLAGENGFHVCYCQLELEELEKQGELAWADVASLVEGPFLRTIPGVHPCDGFFAAILERQK
jgi:16S rRNA (cytosine967-C5)-methyltransferase